MRIARKHLGWYATTLVGGEAFRHEVNRLDTPAAQIAAVNRFSIGLPRWVDTARTHPPATHAVASRVEEALAA